MITHIIWDLGDTINTSPNGGMDLKPLYEYPEVKLRSGVIETLRNLQSKGYIQAVLSNTAVSNSDMARKMLKKLGVDEFFVFVYATQSELDHQKPEKPNPEVYDLILCELKIDRKQAVMVGNSWNTDILGANRSGIHAIWLQNPAISVRKDKEALVQSPPWILPAWDVESVPRVVDYLSSLDR